MAAASLGRLTLDLLVRLGSFEQGMNQADRRTRQTTENMGRAFSGFRDQVADALGGTQIGSIVDSFNAKIGSLRTSLCYHLIYGFQQNQCKRHTLPCIHRFEEARYSKAFLKSASYSLTCRLI